MRPRILNAEPFGFSGEARQVLLGLGEVVDQPLSQSRLVSLIPEFDVLWVRLGLEVNRAVLQAGDRLKVVVSPTTGVDHLDLPAAEERGIRVLCLKDEREFLETISATAEHTWGLLLALVRRVPWAFDNVRAGGWARDGYRGMQLKGKRLGIIGLGRLGRRVAMYGVAFGMKVYAFDREADARAEGVQMCGSLDEVLSSSDVLSVHIPLEENSRRLLDRSRLSLLPPGAVVVNTSRGEIIDEEALVELLQEGQLAGVAVDVLSGERDVTKRRESRLLEYARMSDRVLVTPHLGGATYEAMAQSELYMAHALVRIWTEETQGLSQDPRTTATGPGT